MSRTNVLVSLITTMVKGNIGTCFDISYTKGHIKLNSFELTVHVFSACEVLVKSKFKI